MCAPSIVLKMLSTRTDCLCSRTFILGHPGKANTGLEISGCQEPRAPLNSPVAPSNFCREPENVLFDIQNTFLKLMKMQLGSLEKNLNFEP